jgi:hypothetical protein
MNNAARSRICNWQGNRDYLLIDSDFKYLHGIHEAAFTHRHDQINRVEVFLAIKASCQVGFMVGGGMKVVAQRASEPEPVTCVAYLKIHQIDDNLIDGDFISEHSEKVCRVVFCHFGSSYGR